MQGGAITPASDTAQPFPPIDPRTLPGSVPAADSEEPPVQLDAMTRLATREAATCEAGPPPG